MNERIRELLEQAGVKYVTMPKDTVYEKFAELIVQECIKVCDDTRKLTWTVPLKDDEQITAVVCMIKKHFGVEE